jgi:exosortase J
LYLEGREVEFDGSVTAVHENHETSRPSAIVCSGDEFGAEGEKKIPGQTLLLGAGLAALGLVIGLRSHLGFLWLLWTTDGLGSIGILIPPLSAWLCARAWRGYRCGVDGTWWGFALMAAALTAAWAARYGALALANPHAGLINLLPAGMLVCAYVSGAVLFLGGLEAWKRAGFGLLLLLLVNPVPGFFRNLIDLPLQYAAASTARGFAARLGIALNGDRLHLLFQPKLGMFIAPGCNGLRGAVAMGLLALVFGHLRGLQWRRLAIFTASAVALAYLFNLLRLCALVLAYKAAIFLPRMGPHLLAIDYLIGATLFLTAVLFVFAAPNLFAGRQ